MSNDFNDQDKAFGETLKNDSRSSSLSEMGNKQIPKLGLDDTFRKGQIKELNVILADLSVIYIKTRSYGFNIRGLHFSHLRPFFKELEKTIDSNISAVAERVRVLGGDVVGSMKGVLQNTRLKETSSADFPNEETALGSLRDDHEWMTRHLRRDLEKLLDASSVGRCADEAARALYVDLIRSHERMAWQLRASAS
ncbi:MAG: DNA starvation/stationary phase protection protein [Planctomycetota bacterium]